MRDPLLMKLKKDFKNKVALVNKVIVNLTDKELAILTNKTEGFEIDHGTLLREYLLTTTALKPRKYKKSNEVIEND